MQYDYCLSERIVNLQDFEQLARAAFWTVDALRKEMEKESPSSERIEALSRQAHRETLALKDFEFIIEARKVRMVKNQS